MATNNETEMNENSTATFDRDSIPSVLRQFARRRSTAERCELCSAELAETHSHLLEQANRQILCACEACALLFCDRADAHLSAYSTASSVPRRFSNYGYAMGKLDDPDQPGFLLFR